MNNINRCWDILNWNIRGINSQDKWLAIGKKIEESACAIVCLQETKREMFDVVPIELINLLFCPLVVFLWPGMVHCLKEKLSSKTDSHCL